MNPQQQSSLIRPAHPPAVEREILIFFLCPAKLQKTLRCPCVPPDRSERCNYRVVGRLLLGSNNRGTIKVRMDMIDVVVNGIYQPGCPEWRQTLQKSKVFCLKMSFPTGGSGCTSARDLLDERSSIKGGENKVAPRLHLPAHKGGNYGFQGPLSSAAL